MRTLINATEAKKSSKICIVDEEIREELNHTLIEYAYAVAFRLIGGNRVKFFISW